MEISKSLNQVLENTNEVIKENQNNFLESSLWKVMNTGLNTGIRALLPNIIEDQVIEIKDAIIKNGFKSGAKQAVTSAIDLGKSAVGIVTGNFESITQAHNAIKSGGIIDSVSNVLDFAIDKSTKANLIPNDLGKIIKKGKNTILNTIESNIENDFNNQLTALNKLEKYSDNWNQYFNNQDFEGMEKEYKKIKSTIKTILPIEQTIKKVNKIENLHTLIKNKGKDFNLSEEEMELAGKLVS